MGKKGAMKSLDRKPYFPRARQGGLATSAARQTFEPVCICAGFETCLDKGSGEG